MQETKAQSLSQEDPLEKEMATTAVFLAGKSHGQRRLVGYSPWGHKESDMPERLTLSLSLGIKASIGVKDLVCVRLRCDWSRSLGWGWG